MKKDYNIKNNKTFSKKALLSSFLPQRKNIHKCIAKIKKIHKRKVGVLWL